ncbi:MAG: hypothetical protein ACR2MF_05740 [Chthoniobacterales bacterium]
MLNSAGQWEPRSEPVNVSLGQLLVREEERWVPALTLPRMLDGRGFGNLCKLREQGIYGREIPLAIAVDDENLTPVKWLRKVLAAQDRQIAKLTKAAFEDHILPRILELTGGEIAELVTRGNTMTARVDFSAVEVRAQVDSHGRALQSPPEREALPPVCRDCSEREHGLTTPIESSPAYAWRVLGLVEPDGRPTRRGRVFSFFQGGEGLAIAAALEEESYAIEELIFDIANIRAGPRFAGEDAVMGGRLGILCQRTYGRADQPGYLEMGVPIHYGSGASEVIREVNANPGARYKSLTESLRAGDIERALMEWRSLLRHIVGAPLLEWERWAQLKSEAARFIETSISPALLDLPPLLAAQQRRATAAKAIV